MSRGWVPSVPLSLMQAVCWKGGDWCRPIPRSWTEFALSKEKLGQAWPWCWKGCCPSAQAFTHCLPARADTLSVTQTQEWVCRWCAPDTLSCQHCRAACRHRGNNASSALRTLFIKKPLLELSRFVTLLERSNIPTKLDIYDQDQESPKEVAGNVLMCHFGITNIFENVIFILKQSNTNKELNNLPFIKYKYKFI